MNSPASRSTSLISPHSLKDFDLTVTVIICTRNRPGFLRKCLEAVSALQPPANEVLVVDNSAGDRETELAAREFAARYIIEAMPGLSRARNRGFAESDSDIVAYLDDDATPDEHWLQIILEPFEDPKVAAVTGRIITPQSPIGENVQESPRFVSNQVPHWFEIATFGGLGLGSNMALRKTACTGWTIFDERLGRGAPFEIAEENYAFASLLSLGHTAVYLPNAIVFHPPMRRTSVELEARNSFAYWLLLFAEFPARRLDLLRFLIRRLRRKRLDWPRDPQDPGEIINSGWRVQLKAGFSALFLFLRTSKPKRNQKPA